MAKFNLYGPNGTEITFEDGAKHRFNEHGLLEINLPDGTRFTYSPHAWSSITDQKPKSGRARVTVL